MRNFSYSLVGFLAKNSERREKLLEENLTFNAAYNEYSFKYYLFLAS